MNNKQLIRQLVHDRDGTDLESRKWRYKMASLIKNPKYKDGHKAWRNMLENDLREQEERREQYNQLIYSLIEKTNEQ